MRFLANENFPGEAGEAPRSLGHDVAWVRADSPGSLDEDVLARASSEGRLLITFDKDFGELALRRSGPMPAGIVLFRIPPRSPSHVARVVTSVLAGRTDWTGHFSVIEETRIRMTPLTHPRTG